MTTTFDIGDPSPDGVCGDTTTCSLREAIQEANATPATDTIDFAIAAPLFSPPTASKSIAVTSPLPPITRPVVIDGTTQPAYRGVPIVEVDGSGAGAVADGLVITAGSSTVRGLTINRFSGNGISISGPGGNTIEQNHIGTDIQGVLDLGNGASGIRIQDSGSNTVGGNNLGNVISGNDGPGVTIVGSGSGNSLEENIIGADASGLLPLGNGTDGVFLRAASDTIGQRNVISANGRDGVHVQSGSGIDADHNAIAGSFIGTDLGQRSPLGNGRHGVAFANGASDNTVFADTIAFNQGDGVFVGSGTGNRIAQASIHSNGGLGIDLGPAGVTPNDPGDGDAGANGLQNFPVLTGATTTATSFQVTGTLDSKPNKSYSIDVFASPSCDGSNHGEGADFIDNTTLTTDGSGNGSFVLSAQEHVFGGRALTATATSPGSDTSEFSACLLVPFAHTFTVNTTADNGDATPDGVCDDGAGHCSLREAIQEANAAAGEDLIAFAIPGSGVHTIGPASALPPLSDRATIDGTTQPGFATTPLIELNGTSAGQGTDGLVIAAGPSAIRGLAINRFKGDGIDISQSSQNAVERNFIGTDPSGTSDLGNTGNGVRVDSALNTIGGPGVGNLVSGNGANGLDLEGHVTFVLGNLIGTDATGTAPLGNGLDGVLAHAPVEHIGDPGSAVRNVISANGSDGIEMRSTVVSSSRGNFIGTDVTGTQDLGNSGDGVHISGSGDANAVTGNVISGNGLTGVEVTETPATSDQVIGNLIGLATDGSSPLPNLLGIRVSGTTGAVSIGFPLTGGGNVVSGNTLAGITIASSTNVSIEGNLVGLDAAGHSAVPNGLNGITLSASSSVAIGGTDAFAGNVLSGNGNDGLELLSASHDVTVTGNLVGLDATGSIAVGNVFEGVTIIGGANNTIGGTDPGAANFIAGNATGVEITGSGSTGNQVLGNAIGLDLTRRTGPGNSGAGISVFSSATGTVIGGAGPGAGNLIEGSGGNGISLFSGGNQVLGNSIGVSRDLRNQGDGVEIQGSGNTVGGTGPGEGNAIFSNAKAGVFVTSGTGNRIRGNSVARNTGLGIDLGPVGVTMNDHLDGDSGPNGLQNFPDLAGAVGSATFTSVQGSMDAAASQSLDLDFYANLGCDASGNGEGERFLGTRTVVTDINGAASFVASVGPLRPGEFVTATATDGSGNTSEFSSCIRSVVAGGGSVSADFNHDGFTDLAIGVPGESPSFSSGPASGAVVVVPGTATGLDPAQSIILQQGTGGVLDGPEGGDRFGSALAAGDFNGDGFADLAVGVPGEDVGDVADAGAVNVIDGSAQGLGGGAEQFFTQDSPGIKDMAEAGDAFGSSLAAANFGGTSQADLAVGVPGEGVGGQAGAGAVNVLYGSSPNGLTASGNQLFTQDTPNIRDASEAGDAFGLALAARNLGGTAQADLAIGVPGEDLGGTVDAGAVNVVYGSSAGLSSVGNQIWSQNTPGVLDDPESGDGFGSALAAADFGNGVVADLAVGVPGEDLGATVDAGVVNVLYGTSTGLASTGNQLWSQDSASIIDSAEAGDRFGAALAARNFGLTSRPDLAVGVPGEDLGAAVDAGAVNVIYGSAAGLDPTSNQLLSQGSGGLLDTAETQDGFGASLSVGNYGNGTQGDLAAGVPGEDASAGAVNVVYGTAGGLDSPGNQVLREGSGGIGDQPEPGDRFGNALG